MVDELFRLNLEKYLKLHKFFPEQTFQLENQAIVHFSRLNLWESYLKTQSTVSGWVFKGSLGKTWGRITLSLRGR